MINYSIFSVIISVKITDLVLGKISLENQNADSDIPRN